MIDEGSVMMAQFPSDALFLRKAARFPPIKVVLQVRGSQTEDFIRSLNPSFVQAVQDHTHALDKILSAYGTIGLQMPRFSPYSEVFPEDIAFQHLIAFLFEDIIEFHRRAITMVRKSGTYHRLTVLKMLTDADRMENILRDCLGRV